MKGQDVRGREGFEEQGAEFLRANLGQSEWDYAAHRPPLSRALVGRDLTLVFPDESVRMKLSFREADLDWETLTEAGTGRPRGAVPYEAFESAAGLFFLSFVADEKTSYAFALDLDSGVATGVRGTIVGADIVSTTLRGRVEGTASASHPAGHPALSLGGTRLLNQYADNVAYEHIYLNETYVTWLGVSGPEAGQADTEEYHSFKLRDGLYLVWWKEKVLTVEMTFFFNLLKGECIGQVFGLLDGQPVHKTIGARTTVIHTSLDELPEAPRLRSAGLKSAR